MRFNAYFLKSFGISASMQSPFLGTFILSHTRFSRSSSTSMSQRWAIEIARIRDFAWSSQLETSRMASCACMSQAWECRFGRAISLSFLLLASPISTFTIAVAEHQLFFIQTERSISGPTGSVTAGKTTCISIRISVSFVIITCA